MNRRLFLLSTVGLAATPDPQPTPAPAGDAPAPAKATTTGMSDWLAGVRLKAIAAGVRAETIDQAFHDLTPDPVVLKRDTNQPEFTKPIGDYVSGVVSAANISAGRVRREAVHDVLSQIVAARGVPDEILLAVWGVESAFGKITGDMDVIRSIATQGMVGRRPKFAEQEMIAALKILDQGLASREQMRGSWAGAMGQTQFMPSDYLAYADDGDGDGRKDIWGSSADALASTARFLAEKAHWRRGESWALEATLPKGFDYALAEADARTPAEWATLGVGLASGAEVSSADQSAPAVLLTPQGWRGPAFLAFPNHMAIRAYNNSTAYALAVGLLADQIAGRPPLKAAWPKDPPLQLADRIAAQQALKALGYDPGAVDGVLGVRTRRAAKDWQAAKSLPADGYLTIDLINTLKAEAGLVSAAPPVAAPPSGADRAG